ncbi:hypothetical protein T484DRAFT_2125464 [Baffinella frigidus]|nr:hypothetical protein T484DRAFT_2125464 [Cryptophyta sp. CCMP2293]
MAAVLVVIKASLCVHNLRVAPATCPNDAPAFAKRTRPLLTRRNVHFPLEEKRTSAACGDGDCRAAQILHVHATPCPPTGPHDQPCSCPSHTTWPVPRPSQRRWTRQPRSQHCTPRRSPCPASMLQRLRPFSQPSRLITCPTEAHSAQVTAGEIKKPE